MNKKTPHSIYSPESPLRSPNTLFREMTRDLISAKELAWRLMIRDISAQYRQSLLGILWAFLPPIATAIIFVVLNNHKVINMGAVDVPYPVFAIFGTVLWQIFVDGLNAPLKVVNASTVMLAKINFPKEALILSGLGQTFFHGGIKLFILAVVFIVYRIPVTWTTPLSLLAIVCLILLGITCGLLITPIGILYKDIAQGLTIVTGLWFFLTPVVYPPPATFPFSLLAILNPVSPLLMGARDLATRGAFNNPVAFFAVTLLTLVVLFATWIIYRLAVPILIERMSA